MKAVKETIRKYYKYQYNDWTRPNLTNNGILGGDSFAVQADYNWDGYPAYQAVDGNSNTIWLSALYTTGSYYLYNPNPLNITKIEVSDSYNGNSWFVTGTLYGSNDNKTWIELGTSTKLGDLGFSFDLPNNSQYFNYYKITPTSTGSMGWSINEIDITATQREVVEGSQSDYDFYKDFDTYKLPKIDETYYGIGD